VSKKSVLAALVFSLLLGLPPLAAEPVIRRGIDVLTTVGGGKTFYDFAQNPIPAGFFCARSKAFTGRVALKGLPLTTQRPGQLWGADTVVERLDDVTFDDEGIGVTRLQIRALSLVSIAPIKTACGAYHVYISLGGQQRVATMHIRRTQEGGGDFVVPVAVDARLKFIPVKPARNRAARKLELMGSFTFPARPIPWSLTGGAVAKRIAPVVVDTDGDLTPDTLLPGTSNFTPGQSPGDPTAKATGCSCCPQEICHDDPLKGQHCTVCTGTYSCC
jgi:hypothetical protein